MELYPFQQEDIDKIVRQKAGLIGSEMGTGKTHVAIAIDALWYEKQEGPGKPAPTLIIAPLNTFDSWVEKYEMQAPDVDVYVIDRKDRNEFVQAIMRREADVYLMHWDALRLMPELQKFQFNVIIADEVHRSSNRKAQATKALKNLKANYKLGLSGTASGDKPENLWSINNWLWPSYYTSYWKFRRHYCVEELVQRGGVAYRQIVGVKNADSLHKEMKPWYVRHLKRERCCEHHPHGVMDWLPEKTYDMVWVDLSPIQRKFYDQMRNQMVAWVGEHEDSPLVASVVVAQMVRLSQMALATPSFGEGNKIMLSEPSSKIDAAKELILDHEEKQFVVFSASKQACYLAQRAFEKAGITCEVLSGDTPQNQRDGMVKRFNDKEYRVFIGVIQAAAEGIDGLQRSTDTAIFLDRSWSTVKNMQAEDRLHRDGQKDTVNIIDIMARSTLDFGRKQRLETKWSWIKEILGDPRAAQRKILREEF